MSIAHSGVFPVLLFKRVLYEEMTQVAAVVNRITVGPERYTQQAERS